MFFSIRFINIFCKVKGKGQPYRISLLCKVQTNFIQWNIVSCLIYSLQYKDFCSNYVGKNFFYLLDYVTETENLDCCQKN